MTDEQLIAEMEHVLRKRIERAQLRVERARLDLARAMEELGEARKDELERMMRVRGLTEGS